MNIQSLIRTIPDYPKPGIQFRDITTLLKDADGFRSTIDQFVERYRGRDITKIAGTEARGFLFGAPLAYALGVGFVPVRKQGKLPGKNIVNTPTSAPKNKKDVIHSNSPASAVKKKIVPPTEPSNSKVKKSPANAFNESIIDEQIKKEFLLLRKEIREQRSAGFREFIKNQRKDKT
jgi:hypothetical protein